jgi:hypothetical protein
VHDKAWRDEMQRKWRELHEDIAAQEDKIADTEAR